MWRYAFGVFMGVVALGIGFYGRTPRLAGRVRLLGKRLWSFARGDDLFVQGFGAGLCFLWF